MNRTFVGSDGLEYKYGLAIFTYLAILVGGVKQILVVYGVTDLNP